MGRDCASHTLAARLVNLRFHVGTTLTLRPMTCRWFGNETMCAYVYNIRKWCPTKWTAVGSVMNSFIDQKQFIVMKTLIGHGSVPWDKRQFRAKTTMSTRTSLELVLLNKEERKQERITKMTLSISHTFAFSCLPCAFWESMWALLSIFVGSYMAFA